MLSAFVPGELVWAYAGHDACFQKGRIERLDPHKGTINVRLASGILDVKDSDVHKINDAKQDGAPDNTYLRELNEATLLHNIETRYTNQNDGGCYSVTGHILIAVNPFRRLTIYDEFHHKRYLSQAIGSQPPHIFAVADRMYRLLASTGESQAIIVSGPSGSGKTETCKYVLRHLAYVSKDRRDSQSSKSSEELGFLLVQTNPLLEAFGNAETVLNKNSSRFGKFVQVIVSNSGAILGASIQTYLLETTRVVAHAANECSYHIHYQLVLGATVSQRKDFQIDSDPNKYAYLRSATGKATTRRGEDASEWKVTHGVLELLKVKHELVLALFQTLSGLLDLGSIFFHENPNGDSVITGHDELQRASKLLGTNISLLQQALCSRTMKLKGSEMQIPLKPDEARSSRDALAKAVYLKLFGWVVQQVNAALLDARVTPSDHGFLGILDIYGFENFEKNSLEQLFINFTNEQLHQHFAVSLFKTEEEIYAAEGILWPGVEWEDNSECIETIAGKSPSSIFNALTEHSRLPNSSDAAMTESLLSAHRKSKTVSPPKLTSGVGRARANRLTHKEAFVIHHFAGDVVYRTEGWLSKNTDSLHEDLSLCMSSSTSLLLAQLFQQGSLVNAIGGGRSGGSRRAGFVAEKYARQLEILMLTLRSTHSHFVRCIKPNQEQLPHCFTSDLVLQQLLNSGMVDAVRLLSAGYPTRVAFETLEKQFKPLAPDKFQRLPPALFSAALLTAFDLSHSDFLLGLTRAFFKSGKLAFVDSLASRAGALDEAFFAKMGKLLSLWRLRRGISAVRCLNYLESKMRRLRALWKFRRSATVANLVGRSWVRRANEIRYGRAIEMLQALGRGFTTRRLRQKMTRGIESIQKMGRGYLARVYRDKLKARRAAEVKARAKAERERKIRERKEAMEQQEADTKAQQLAADRVRRQRMKDAAAKASTGAKGPISLSDERSMSLEGQTLATKHRVINVSSMPESAVSSAADVDDADMSDGSDLRAEDSDDELNSRPSFSLQDPRALLAATAALDVRAARCSSSGNSSAMPGLNLNRVSVTDANDEVVELDRSSSLSARSSSMSQRGKASWVYRKTALGSMSPRASGFFSTRRSTGTGDTRRMIESKTAKGYVIAAAMLRVAKRAGESGHQERFALLVGDVLLIFMLAAQPEIPLPLRLWPAQLVCLGQSNLVGAGGLQPEVHESAMTVTARDPKQGALGLLADDHSLMERYALAMSVGVASVRRARQQAKLSLAQQLCHEKKLSLLKTQHMIDLLHKSQEMFFEAGSGQFDDCNAVCMHSGVMRQSLIDVTPFMPVSDFICEYCSCVIIPEEQCAAAGEMADSKADDHKQVLKREQQRKLQLDDETLLLARDVRSLRERRKGLEEDVCRAWEAHTSSLNVRQRTDARLARLELSQKVETMTRDELERARSQLLLQLDSARKYRAQAATQLLHKQERQAKREAADALEEAALQVPADKHRSSLVRKLSFSRRKKEHNPVIDSVASAAEKTERGQSGLTRVLSFGRRNRTKTPGASQTDDMPTPTDRKRESVTGTLVRKLSFGKRRGL